MPFFGSEKVEAHYITVPFVKSADNMADFFTKPLPPYTSVLPAARRDHERRELILSPVRWYIVFFVLFHSIPLTSARTHALAIRATARPRPKPPPRHRSRQPALRVGSCSRFNGEYYLAADSNLNMGGLCTLLVTHGCVFDLFLLLLVLRNDA
eukprot:644572-Pleurochrysis_carterae.AAC.1